MRYPFVPLPQRGRLRWPDDKRLALIVTVNLEYWDLLKETAAPYYAGGPAKYANLRAVTVIHAGTRKQYDLGNLQKGKTTDNPVLADGDMVQVPQGSTFEWGNIWGAIGALGLFGVHI